MNSNIKTVNLVLITLAALFLAADVIIAVTLVSPAIAGQSGVHPGKGINSVVMEKDDDYLYIVDQKTKRVGVYRITERGEIVPRGMRNYKYDVLLRDAVKLPSTGASVKAAKKALEKQQKIDEQEEKRKARRNKGG